MMYICFIFTYSHVRLTTVCLCMSRHCQVISQKSFLLEFVGKLCQKLFLKLSILPSYKNIHISTSLFSPSIRTTNLNFMRVFGTYKFIELFLHKAKHLGDFFSWNSDFKIFQVLETYLLIFS